MRFSGARTSSKKHDESAGFKALRYRKPETLNPKPLKEKEVIKTNPKP